MAAKAALRVIQDSKHVGTVTRQQIDKVIREIEAEHFAHKHESVSNSTRSKNGGASAKH
jgi:hypothetical protein